MTKKQLLYEQNIRRSLAEIYSHMCDNLLGFLDDDGDFIDTESLTHEQLDNIEAVRALEEEWVLDPAIRHEMSLLRFSDDD